MKRQYYQPRSNIACNWHIASTLSNPRESSYQCDILYKNTKIKSYNLNMILPRKLFLTLL